MKGHLGIVLCSITQCTRWRHIGIWDRLSGPALRWPAVTSETSSCSLTALRLEPFLPFFTLNVTHSSEQAIYKCEIPARDICQLEKRARETDRHSLTFKSGTQCVGKKDKTFPPSVCSFSLTLLDNKEFYTKVVCRIRFSVCFSAHIKAGVWWLLYSTLLSHTTKLISLP